MIRSEVALILGDSSTVIKWLMHLLVHMSSPTEVLLIEY